MAFTKKSAESQAVTTSPFPGITSHLVQSLSLDQLRVIAEYLGVALADELSDLKGAMTEAQTVTTLSDETRFQLDIAAKLAHSSPLDAARVRSALQVALEIANVKAQWIAGPFVPFVPAASGDWSIVPTSMNFALDLLAATRISGSLFGPHTILKADGSSVIASLTVDEQRLVGRITGGGIAALTAAQILTLLGGTTGTGALVRQTNPTIVTPTISVTGWANATHAHTAANSGGTLVPSAVPRLQKHSFPIHIASPAAAADHFVIFKCHSEIAITITRIQGETTTAQTCTFNLYWKAEGSAEASPGTQIGTSSVVADSDGDVVTAFDDATIPAGSWIFITVSAVSGTTDLFGSVEYTVDDS